VRRPELQTVRELNSREFIPWLKSEWSLIFCPGDLNVMKNFVSNSCEFCSGA
jgi:hypothetical protein